MNSFFGMITINECSVFFTESYVGVSCYIDAIGWHLMINIQLYYLLIKAKIPCSKINMILLCPTTKIHVLLLNYLSVHH